MSVACMCADIEQCRTEVYISDVRLALLRIDNLEHLLRNIARVLGTYSSMNVSGIVG